MQRSWEDVAEGDEIGSIEFPLTVHRLIVHVAANRDFGPVHHNEALARAGGAPDMYANNVFHQGMWERVVRLFIGLDGVIKKIGPMRMKRFAVPGDTAIVSGSVTAKWREGTEHLLELSMRSTDSIGETVVGSVTVALPSNANAAHR
ncbi:hypothetical protein ASJ79_00225 [Mycobacterium sp. NAZ190054]|nr:hypothetical protein ASJ79_00225 [Mycobacterium sp. NAZ190054]